MIGIERVNNGVLVYSELPGRNMATTTRDTYVFNSFNDLSEWLREELKSTGDYFPKNE